MSGLPCVNCQEPTSEQDAKLFAGVFVCMSCHARAGRVYIRGESELRRLLCVYQEAIRIALIEGRLFGPEQYEESPSKESVLREVIALTSSQ